MVYCSMTREDSLYWSPINSMLLNMQLLTPGDRLQISHQQIRRCNINTSVSKSQSVSSVHLVLKCTHILLPWKQLKTSSFYFSTLEDCSRSGCAKRCHCSLTEFQLGHISYLRKQSGWNCRCNYRHAHESIQLHTEEKEWQKDTMQPY